MPRILCLGYSVTELPGYIERLNQLTAAEGRPLAFVRSGWGGHSINSIAYIVDEIVEGAGCDYVLLELFTGSVRFLSERRIRAYLDEVLIALARRGLPVAFLNLYQGGVDYPDDGVTRLIEAYAARHRIPLLDLATVVHGLSEGDRAVWLRDNVHTTVLGGDLYGDLIYDFLKNPPVSLAYARGFRGRRRRYLSLAVPALAPQNPRFVLHRNGTPITFAEIPAGGSLDLPLDPSQAVESVMVSYGPRSGRLGFRAESGDARSILPYDGYCYYVRSGTIDLKLQSGRRLRIAQDGEVPAIPLHKGEPDFGPRLGRVSHLFCRRPTPLTRTLWRPWPRVRRAPK